MRGKNKQKAISPSARRREILKAKEANKVPPISNLTPIERYYDVADKLKQLFETNLSDHKLDNAYVYGIRFAKFSANALPSHGYYRSSKRELKQSLKKNQKDLRFVIDSLEQVVKLMDLEELEKVQIQKREEAALRKIREREAVMRKEEEGRKAQKELMDRLNALDTMFPPTPTGVGDTQTNVELPTYDQASSMLDNINEMPIGGDLPPPIPMPMPIPFAGVETAPSLPYPQGETGDSGAAPPPPPPSYNDLLKQNSRFDSIANLRPADSTSSRDLMNDPMSQSQNHLINSGIEPATLINPLGKEKKGNAKFNHYHYVSPV